MRSSVRYLDLGDSHCCDQYGIDCCTPRIRLARDHREEALGQGAVQPLQIEEFLPTHTGLSTDS